MGFLAEGKTLTWEEAKKVVEFIRTEGIKQFLILYHKLKGRKGDTLLWGDEIEYMIVCRDEENNRTTLSLRGHELIDQLNKQETEYINKTGNPRRVNWVPEYGRHMLEGTPGVPYGSNRDHYKEVEGNMRARRLQVEALLQNGERILSLTSFPRMGVSTFTTPPLKAGGPVTQSDYVPDGIIHPHPRFSCLTANIRERRGEKVNILVPLFKDKNTDLSCAKEINGKHFIHMDAMAFGMGCSCVQCTFQCCNINEARHLYDQLAVLCPVMLAVTAACPLFKGLIGEQDVRWSVISDSVDDRTPYERNLLPQKDNKYVIPKSRYESCSLYISNDETMKEEYNDLDVVYDKDIFKKLVANDVDERLAKHIAHLFIRDPLVIYDNKIEIDNETHSDHFENIQSTNWQTVRFKPPPPNSPIGWRVEFRVIEAQLTDFENAALVVFVVLLSRITNTFELNFYTPISKVDENMKKAHKRDAVLNEKFFFRKNPMQGSEDEYELMSADEIVNGKEDGFIGLIPLVNTYLDTITISEETREVVSKYLQLISMRASGKLLTTAAWIRRFVTSHPDYKHDSVVSEKINHDLLDMSYKITHQKVSVPELFGNLY